MREMVYLLRFNIKLDCLVQFRQYYGRLVHSINQQSQVMGARCSKETPLNTEIHGVKWGFGGPIYYTSVFMHWEHRVLKTLLLL